MAKAVGLRSDYDADQLRALSRRERDGRVVKRLLALAWVYEGKSRQEIAAALGVKRSWVWYWVKRFNEQGVEGLRDSPRSGRPRKLDEGGIEKLLEVVEGGPEGELVRWRCQDLAQWVEEQFGVRYHPNSIGRILHEHGYAWMSGRPQAVEADPVAQEDFKKTSPTKCVP